MPRWPAQSLADRFLSKLGPPTATGCREWTGAYSRKRDGLPPRPVFWIARTRVEGESYWTAAQVIIPAARMALHLADGVPLDERAGVEACHRPIVCDNPKCCEAAHLYWGTREENAGDRRRKANRWFGQFGAVS